MDGILEWVGGFGAAAVLLVIGIGTFAGAIYAGCYVARAAKRNWAGWVAGVAVFIVIVAVMEPTYHAVKRVSCHASDDYESCMSDDDDDG